MQKKLLQKVRARLMWGMQNKHHYLTGGRLTTSRTACTVAFANGTQGRVSRATAALLLRVSRATA